MAKQFQSKALRALGISAASKLPPKSIVKASTAHNSLLFSDYRVFWTESLEKVQTANKFFCEAVNKIIEIEKQEKAKPTVKFDVDRVVYSLIHTIQFIDLFCPVDTSVSMVTKTLANWESFKKDFKGMKPTSRFSAFERAMTNFKKRHLRSATYESSLHGVGDSSQGLVLECAFVDPMDQALVIHGLRDRRFSVLEDFPFLFHHLKVRMQHGGESCFHIFISVLKLLTGIPAHTRAKPIVAGSTLGNVLALLLLLREFLYLLPVADSDLLRKALEGLHIFRTWPAIYANVARELEVAVLKELISPGNAMRLRIMQENPMLTAVGEGLLARCGRTEVINWSMSQRKVYVYYNENLARGVILRQLCSQDVPRGSLYDHQMHRTRSQLLLTMIQTGLSTSSKRTRWPDDLIPKLEVAMKKPEIVERWFARARDAIYENPQATGGDVLVAILKEMDPTSPSTSELHKRKPDPTLYAQDAGGGNGHPVAPPHTAPHSRTSSSGGGAFPVSNTSAVSAPMEGAWNHHVFEAPALGLTFRGVINSAMHLDGAGKVSMNYAPQSPYAGANGARSFLVRDRHKCPERYPKYANDFDNLVRDVKYAIAPGPKQRYPRPQVGDGCDTPSHSKPKVRIMALGGHEVLHRVVCNLVALQAMRPDLHSLVDIECFVVPIGSNALASFVAQRDGWYRRQVYAAFQSSLTMSPQLRVEEDSTVPGDSVTRVLQESFFEANKYVESRRAAREAAEKAALVRPPAGSGGVEAEPQHRRATEGQQQHGKPGRDGAVVLPGVGNEAPVEPVQENIPAVLLQQLLQDYVRGARQRLNVRVYKCECWSDPGVVDFANLAPDVTIPFCTRAEIGLGASMATYVRMGLNHRQKTKGILGSPPHLGRTGARGTGGGDEGTVGEHVADPSWDEIVQDREFSKSWFEPSPDLRVSMLPMDIKGEIHEDPMDRIELRDGSYFSISICNMPAYTCPTSSAGNRVTVIGHEPDGSAANPTYPSLEVNAISMKGSCTTLLNKKDKKPRDVEALKEAMRDEAEREHVGVVDISASSATRTPFLVCLDGQLFGPFYRIRVAAAKTKYTNQIVLPVMTFFPTDM